jgi:hypothetical protein
MILPNIVPPHGLTDSPSSTGLPVLVSPSDRWTAAGGNFALYTIRVCLFNVQLVNPCHDSVVRNLIPQVDPSHSASTWITSLGIALLIPPLDLEILLLLFA